MVIVTYNNSKHPKDDGDSNSNPTGNSLLTSVNSDTKTSSMIIITINIPMIMIIMVILIAINYCSNSDISGDTVKRNVALGILQG